MGEPLTLGVEEEFQTVDVRSLELARHGYSTLMRRATPAMKERMIPEFYQCVVECKTEICRTIEEVRQQTLTLRATALKLARGNGLAIVSAGTHPISRWDEQVPTAGERYAMVETLLRDVARTVLIYGLHVHVGITDEARRIEVMNQARAFLPYILALSVNSPFWMGRYTGYQSYRTMVWAPFPLSGMPDAFPSVEDYRRFRELFQHVGALGHVEFSNGKTFDLRRMWWDIRSHHALPTLEFRIADMPRSHADMVALVAFIQALAQTLLRRSERGRPLPVLPTVMINENRWRAARWGLRGKLVDFVREREVPAVELIAEALDFVGDAAEELGTTSAIAQLRGMLEPAYKTGAERQIEAFARRHELRDVVRQLVKDTAQDVDCTVAMPQPPEPFLARFGLRRTERSA
jgi:carboxylate-amine ligase